MWPIGPVDKDADGRVVDRAEPGNRLGRFGQKPFDEVRLATQLLESLLQLFGRFADLRTGPFIRPLAVVARPENGYAFHERTPGVAVRKEVMRCYDLRREMASPTSDL